MKFEKISEFKLIVTISNQELLDNSNGDLDDFMANPSKARQSFLKILDQAEDEVGFHVNDSKNPLGAHKDRHANIGYGTIGFDPLLKIINHEKLKSIPKILETPYIGETDDDKARIYPPYKFEIAMIKEGKFNENMMQDIRAFYSQSVK